MLVKPCREKDGFQSSTVRISCEEKEVYLTSSWRQGGKRQRGCSLELLDCTAVAPVGFTLLREGGRDTVLVCCGRDSYTG